MNFARSLWLRIETLHAVTYFGAETNEAGEASGLAGFWMGYFGFRSAPMGQVGSAVVQATFFNFASSFVERWVPDVWQRASPESLVTARSEAAAKTLTRLFPSIAGVAAKTNEELHRAIGRCGVGGRPLFAANRQVELPDDPVATFWQLCTSLREHRGDGHVAALTAAGLDGIEAHVLISLDQGTEPGDLQRTRGWTAHDWSEAVERCQERGLVNPARHLSDTGRALRHNIEATTDRLASSAWHGVAERDRDALIAMLTPAAKAVSNSGLIRYPNPIGLPAID